MTRTTTIRLDPALKRRIDRLATRLDQSAHRVMVDAIEQQVSAAEARLAFEAEVERRDADFEKRGVGFTLDELEPWLQAAARGKRAPLPRARKLR